MIYIELAKSTLELFYNILRTTWTNISANAVHTVEWYSAL